MNRQKFMKDIDARGTVEQGKDKKVKELEEKYGVIIQGIDAHYYIGNKKTGGNKRIEIQKVKDKDGNEHYMNCDSTGEAMKLLKKLKEEVKNAIIGKPAPICNIDGSWEEPKKEMVVFISKVVERKHQHVKKINLVFKTI